MTRSGSPVLADRYDAALAGSTAAQALYREVLADPRTPLQVAVAGPGGCGKSTLLDALAHAWASAGVAVAGLHDVPAQSRGAGGAVVLVDDAHLLGADGVDRVRALLDVRGTTVVVAHRPWPRPRVLAAALRRRRPAVQLAHLDRDRVAERLAAATGSAPPPALLDAVVAQTGGWPLLLDRVLDAWPPETGAPAVPGGLLDELRDEVDVLDDDVRALLLAVAAGAALDDDVLAPVLGVDAAAAPEVVDAARATGMLLPDGALVPLVRRAVLAATPAERVRAVQRRLLAVQLERGAPALPLARGLVGAGVRDPRVAAALEAAGDAALRSAPAHAATLFDEAERAGAPPLALAVRRAEAAALSGDLDAAIRLTDSVVHDPDAPDLARGVTVAAAVLAHRGLLARSAELYRWLGPARAGTAAPLAAVALLGTGAVDEARAMLAAADAGRPPTSVAGAATLLARGLLETLDGPSAPALSSLTRAAVLLEPGGRAALLPDTPAALAAVVALHCGEVETAESVLDRAIATGSGGALAEPRHHLLLGWCGLLRGDAAQVRTCQGRAAASGRPLEPRDALVSAALDVGLARRANDAVALGRAFAVAREALLRHPVDLFALLPLGEVHVAAARLGEVERLTPHLAQARDVLARLGEPVLWATPLHWCGLHAAILGDDPAGLRPHAAALLKAARTSPFAAVLAAAGRAWTQVLAREFDPDDVVAAARRLQDVGLSWDGSRLAGQAAVRTPDKKAMTALLQCARGLQAAAVDADSAPDGDAAPAGSAEPLLSEREREVGRLMLANMTYREIGDQLFIAAKTVEHHAARMRQRLGVETRSEMFAKLREVLGDG